MAEDPDVLTGLGRLLLLYEPKDALKFFLKAVEKQPDDAFDVMEEAIAYEATGDEGDAIKTLEQAICLDPSLERAYFELAHLYATLGQHTAGIP